jgi:ATP-binding cassette subfamily B protein
MVIGTISIVALNMFIPVLVGVLVDQAILPKNLTNSEKLDRLVFFTVLILIIGLTRVLLQYCTIFITNSLGWQAIRDIRIEFFEAMQKKPLRFHDRVRSGDLMALATNDMNQLSGMINPGIRMIAGAFISLLMVIILSFNLDITLTLVLIPFFLIYLWTIRDYNKRMRPISATFLHKWSNISRSAQDAITGVRVVRAFNGEEFENNKFREVVVEFKKTWDVRQMMTAKYWPLLVMYLTIGFSFFFGTWLVLEGQLSLGALIGINGMLILLLQPTFIISFAIAMFQGGLAGGERIFHTMMAEEAEESGKTISQKIDWPTNINGAVSFKNVNFKYEGTDKYVLNNLNFSVVPGETVALVGPTGSGKTTLTKLILRFYEYEGEICIDGVNITNYRLRDLRQNIGRVEQDIFLFASSIKENITFGLADNQKISDEDVIKAAQTAQAHEFILKQNKGYETIVGERGVGLSGGQRQRIAIARCLLTDPPILILDDSTSAIDSETEEKIASAMEHVMKNRTTFLITHRLSAIRKADKIIVLKDGTIKAIGKHEELLQTSPDYRRIYSKQIKLPELSEDTKRTPGTDFSLGGAD